MKTFDSSYFWGKNHFEEDGTQKYLVFNPMCNYFECLGNTDNISELESRGWSNEVIKDLNNTLAPTLKYAGKITYLKVNGSWLKKKWNHIQSWNNSQHIHCSTHDYD